jgi:AAA domain
MGSLSHHQSTSTTKLLLIGDSGAGKTGSLASLVEAGYKLRVLDLDNGLDILTNVIRPDLLDQVKYQTITDSMRNVNGRLIAGRATVWQRVAKALESWKTETEDFGSITTWDRDTVLVVDSLSMLSTGAVNFVQSMNARLGQKMTWDDIYGAQQLLETFAQTIYDDAVKCQVIVTAHPDFIKDQSGIERGYPATVGNKLSPKFGRYFNNVLEVKRRQIWTESTAMEVKTSAPKAVRKNYPVETGLAEFFKAVQANPLPAKTQPVAAE